MVVLTQQVIADYLNVALLQSSAVEDYEWNEQERPLIAHDQFDSDQSLPVIDITPLVAQDDGSTTLDCRRHQRQACIAQMVKASQEWGFFQVIGHGVSEELIKKMQKQAMAFFELSLEQKNAVLRNPDTNKPMGYSCGRAGTRLKNDIPWMESLQLPCVDKEMEAYTRKVWRDGNKDFRGAAREFSREVGDLAMKIAAELMGELWKEQEEEEEGMEEEEEEAMVMGGGQNSVVRFNCYPPCPQPERMLGLGAHSDPHLLTLLHQDLVGGLQIKDRHGRWIALQPRHDSFVVNVGDALQVWSNDVYRSVEHRVVCNANKPRLSMAFFLNPMDEATITPLTKNGTPLYEPFTWKEYRDHMYNNRPKGKSNLLHFKIT